MNNNTVLWQWLPALVLMVMILAGTAGAQTTPAPPAPASAVPAPPATQPFKPEELQQLVAPIALYPDPLVAQVLMAATYPLEIVQADRWLKANKDLKGDALDDALEKNSWDASVKSLVQFPQVLEMMDKQLDWTTRLGDAVIADQSKVMDAIQKLRAKAQAEGTLKSNEQQTVNVESSIVVQPSAAPTPQVITIQPTNPQVIYVPSYNPTVVYGAWPYPAYPPPAPYYPAGYVATGLISFGAGVALGAVWSNAWGGCDWNHGSVDVNVNRNSDRSRNVNRENTRSNIQNRNGTFQHDSSHRKGVSYRDQATAQRMDRSGSMQAAQARQDFRGRTAAGPQNSARGGGNVGAGRTSPGAGAGRSAASPGLNRPSPTAGASRGGAFNGVNSSGASARASSSRGQVSRGASSAPRSSGGGTRGGGGGRSGGGSRGGGGGRR